ncbi:hydrolase [Coniochaeta ligniaria NRRL 30616]|uniref:Hydrolase n=1 Tax=Coniochaeta ligniaria NRRL 30616 TaxID=1408157 RepID=A0A1J7JP76_9PEZI|nr:hydrolase [Coniochaeta ligniaria NRRL 30616]
MVKEVEGTFEIDGKSLYTKSWLPDDAPKATLVFIHGFSDHINRYQDLFTHLATRRIAVHGYDQRGWGRSVTKPAERGLTGPTSRVLADMAAFIRRHVPRTPGSDPPLFVMGNSMGGGQVLTLLSDTAGTYGDLVAQVRGWLCEAPLVGLAPEETPGWLKVFSARLVGKVLPRLHMVQVIPAENLSRLPEVQKSIREDALMHNTGTIEGLSGMLDRTEELSSGRTRPVGSGKVRALWIGHGTADKGTAYAQTKKWFDNCAGTVEDREMKTYEGAYHQLHADLCREEFERDVADWILARAGGNGEATTGEAAPGVEAAETKPVESKGLESKL